MSSNAKWPSQAYLDALRPGREQSVRSAILASYSADLVSVGAALLALAGLDDERGSGRKADFADAIERLRGKVRVVIQRGRLAQPRRIPHVAGILDQFIQEVGFDERERSWHPKVALVEFEGPNDVIEWRVWIGSRNLTAAVNLDTGLLLASANDTTGRDVSAISGMGDLGARLARFAGLGDATGKRIQRSLRDRQWKHPTGMRVERVDLTGDGVEPVRPNIDANIDAVIAVSPFLDGSFVGSVGKWGNARTERTILSTLPELSKLALQKSAPLSGFKMCLALDAPPADVADAGLSPTGEHPVPSDQAQSLEEEIGLGLHAKILAVRKGKKLRMWVGSANATSRAWEGRNAEVIAEIHTDERGYAGLMHLLTQGRPIGADTLASYEIQTEDDVPTRLDRARSEVAAKWDGFLRREGNAFSIVCMASPHPTDDRIRLDVGLLAGDLQSWQRNVLELELGSFEEGLQSEILRFRVSLSDYECAWLQRVRVEPAIDTTIRDRAALIKHLGARGFLEWVASQMNGDTAASEVDEAWDDFASAGPQNHNPKRWFEGGAFSLEAMLACWVRDPKAFRELDARLGAYIEPFLARAESESPEDHKLLREFHEVWQTVSSGLLEKAS